MALEPKWLRTVWTGSCMCCTAMLWYFELSAPLLWRLSPSDRRADGRATEFAKQRGSNPKLHVTSFIVEEEFRVPSENQPKHITISTLDYGPSCLVHRRSADPVTDSTLSSRVGSASPHRWMFPLGRPLLLYNVYMGHHSYHRHVMKLIWRVAAVFIRVCPSSGFVEDFFTTDALLT